MYFHAESVKVDTDEGALTLVVETDHDPITINIHGIDLEAFYHSFQSGVGGYLREMEEARISRPTAFRCDPDESGGYDLSDPKHPDWHSIHADIYDSREGK